MTALASVSTRALRSRRRRVVALLAAIVVVLCGAASLGSGVAIKAKAVVAQILLEHAWSKSLAEKRVVKPWGWADVWPVAKIEVPRLHNGAIVLSGVSGEAMAFGPGLMPGPVPGEAGLAIIAAHRDTHFRFLKDIRIGDDVSVTDARGRRHRFKIVETRIVKADRSGLEVDGGPSQIALVTCWPFDAKVRGDDRFVAIGVLD